MFLETNKSLKRKGVTDNSIPNFKKKMTANEQYPSVFHFVFPQEPRITLPQDKEAISIPSSSDGRASPCLPPKLREAERMLHVQHWINAIETTSTDSYYSFSSGSTTASSSLPSCSYPGGSAAANLNLHTTSTSIMNAGQYKSASPLHLQSVQNTPQAYASHNVHNGNVQSNGVSMHTNSRYFDELETRLIVDMFRDFFVTGSCPSLGEVRQRIAETSLQDNRNATSVRSKVKRLQTNGKWTNYS